jgi:hypothetical protein
MGMRIFDFENKALFYNAVANSDKFYAAPGEYPDIVKFLSVVEFCGFTRLRLERDFSGIDLMDFSYVIEYPFEVSAKKGYIYDVAIFARDGQAMYVELDGPEHKDKKQRDWDRKKEKAAVSRGRYVLRLTYDEIRRKSPEDIVASILEGLRRTDPDIDFAIDPYLRMCGVEGWPPL